MRFFYLSRGKRKGEEKEKPREEKQRKEQYTHRVNSNLPGGSIAKEKGRVLLFINRGKAPLFYKKQYKRRKSKGKSITSEKTLKKKNLFEIFLSEVMPGKEKAHSSRQEDKNIHLSRTMPSVKKIMQQNHFAFSFFEVYFSPRIFVFGASGGITLQKTLRYNFRLFAVFSLCKRHRCRVYKPLG